MGYTCPREGSVDALVTLYSAHASSKDWLGSKNITGQFPQAISHPVVML